MQTHKITLKELDEMYPDDPPRRNATPIVIYHEFRAPAHAAEAAKGGASRFPRGSSGARMSSAWLALRMMLMVLGGVVSVAYTASLPRILQFGAAGTAALIWLLLYKMIRVARA